MLCLYLIVIRVTIIFNYKQRKKLLVLCPLIQCCVSVYEHYLLGIWGFLVSQYRKAVCDMRVRSDRLPHFISLSSLYSMLVNSHKNTTQMTYCVKLLKKYIGVKTDTKQ